MSRLRTVYKEFLIAIIPVIAIALIARLATGTFGWSEMFADKSQLEGLVIERSADLTTSTGERHNLWVEIENRSDRAWQQEGENSVCLLADKVVEDPFYTEGSTWLTENKIGLFEKEVAPGEMGHFKFTISTEDIINGVYTEIFELVDNDLQELQGVKPIVWTITVADPVWGFELVSQSKNPTIEPGTVGTLSAHFKNTGNTVWHNYGEYPVKLAVSGERETEFYIDPRWPDEFHPGFVDESSVMPGEEGTFTFDVLAPEALGVTRGSFVPEVFGIDDLDLPEVSFDITVAETGEAQVKDMEPQTGLVTDKDTLRLVALPVGHGDSYVLITPSEDVVVFDTGHPSRANVVVTALKKLGIDKIDYLILSHSHWDHIGGAPYLMDVFPVDKIFVNGEGYPYQTYARLAEYFANGGNNVEVLSAGDRVDIGSEVSIDIYNPATDLTGINEDDEAVNNNSIVARVAWQGRDILLTSDIYADTMDELLEAGFDLKADILTLPHHGNNGWGEIEDRFMDVVAPTVAIKSSDWGELETQTSEAMLSYLENNNIDLVSTAANGEINISLDTEALELEADNIIWRN